MVFLFPSIMHPWHFPATWIYQSTIQYRWTTIYEYIWISNILKCWTHQNKPWSILRQQWRSQDTPAAEAAGSSFPGWSSSSASAWEDVGLRWSENLHEPTWLEKPWTLLIHYKKWCAMKITETLLSSYYILIILDHNEVICHGFSCYFILPPSWFTAILTYLDINQHIYYLFI